jgi:hypothetical protein
MCPAYGNDFKSTVCPECDFKIAFQDERGWIYFVRSGLGVSTFKAFFRKPGKSGSHGCRMTEWRGTFSAAQEDLNWLAKKKGWKEVKYPEH